VPDPGELSDRRSPANQPACSPRHPSALPPSTGSEDQQPLLGNRPDKWVLNRAGATQIRVRQPAAPIELPLLAALRGLPEQSHSVADIRLDVARGLELKGHRELPRVQVTADNGIDDLRVPEQADHEGVTRLGHELAREPADEQLEGRRHLDQAAAGSLDRCTGRTAS
jgi:hypothetical protein